MKNSSCDMLYLSSMSERLRSQREGARGHHLETACRACRQHHARGCSQRNHPAGVSAEAGARMSHTEAASCARINTSCPSFKFSTFARNCSRCFRVPGRAMSTTSVVGRRRCRLGLEGAGVDCSLKKRLRHAAADLPTCFATSFQKPPGVGGQACTACTSLARFAGCPAISKLRKYV